MLWKKLDQYFFRYLLLVVRANLAYVPPRAGLRTPAFGYEFVWGYPGAQQVDRWREAPRKSDLIRVSRRYDLKLVGVDTNPDSADYKKSIVGYIFKNAVL